MPVLTRVPALSDLADRVRDTDGRWESVHVRFGSWARRPELRSDLRSHLMNLNPLSAGSLIARSRETTTHYAWCLRDRPTEPFSFWLHEYKPQHDWRAGYADSVHNHRYHFCTVLLRGGYLHERFTTTLDDDTGLISSAAMTQRTECGVGTSGFLLASEFHRIPQAADDTMTFLIKSRPVTGWSLSYDPHTGVGQRHVPVESRLEDLTSRI